MVQVNIDCPHCFIEVYPSRNICPSCQADVTAQPDHNLIAIDVKVDSVFQPNCHRCNMPSNRTARATVWGKNEYECSPNVELSVTLRLASLFLGLLSPIFTIFSALINHAAASSDGPRMGVGEYKQVLALPTCKDCLKQGIHVIDSNPQVGSFRVAVDRTFANRNSSSLT